MALAEFPEPLSLQISPITWHEMDVVIKWIPGINHSEPKTNGLLNEILRV
jgi:hypothetical protein